MTSHTEFAEALKKHDKFINSPMDIENLTMVFQHAKIPGNFFEALDQHFSEHMLNAAEAMEVDKINGQNHVETRNEMRRIAAEIYMSMVSTGVPQGYEEWEQGENRPHKALKRQRKIGFQNLLQG